jgi:hypothetical protein
MGWPVYSNLIARGGEVQLGLELDDRDQVRRPPADRSKLQAE